MPDTRTIDAMWDDSPIDVSTEVNFIWSIANKLRGPYQSDKYKDVIIPMTIIRRFECALAPTKDKVVAQFEANPSFPVKAMYRVSGFQFFNTSRYTLAELVNDSDHLAANFRSYLQGFSPNVLEILMSAEKGLDFGKKKGYDDIHALVAFSGKVTLPDNPMEYTEAGMNGFPEDRLPKEFDGDYQVLLVANKYQTGFDQPKLCAMYVLKKLKGVSAVQTLSRLNRICPPFEKKTFVLDFVNTYEEITNAFAPFFTTTLLSNSVTPTAIYDLEAQIDAYAVLDPDDIEKANELLYKPNISSKDKQKLTFYFKRSKNMIEQYDLLKQHEIVGNMRHFVRFYEFLLQVSCFEDVDLHKKYNFITYLMSYINIKHPGGGFNLDGKIKATNFVQKKAEEHTQSTLVAKPVVKLPTAESFGLTEAKEERLSQIIAEINSRTGKAYDNDVAVKAMLQIRDILMKSERLRTSAKNNTVQDFEFSYFDDIDDALIEGLEQNQDFFSLLLGSDEIKRQVLGIFTEEIYKSLREA